jgi:HPt (histidine-containing phosphotransfer) domain-containing protein
MSMGSDRKAEGTITVYIDQGLEEIVPGFLENRRRDVQTVETALEQNDFNTICVIGHRMRGDGGGYGFDAISTIGEGMEQAAARQDKEAIRRHLSSLVDFLARITVVYR